MDWIFDHYARLDCRSKVISFCEPGKSSIELVGYHKANGIKLNSTNQARRALWKGELGILAHVINKPKDVAKIEDVPIVSDFVDVFPNELTSLPVDREVEFTIENSFEALPRVESSM
ncbi:hypothetical protein BUALT_Bualt04G0060800 [Buddleja alternifolia]|uniref:Uncharacterized protein n=1 Tax=Buddleja alternifolia TaxID=168488 RepID=A0AAV6XLP6_9LAMI|nr:hypothetical protein BUALT_Bualt04G0060800 [Buddleja alternifolia]